MGKIKYIALAFCLSLGLVFFNNCTQNQFKSSLDQASFISSQSQTNYIKNLNSNIQDQLSSINTVSADQAAADVECSASDLAAWKNCVAKVANGKVNRINVTGVINCADQNCFLSVTSVPQFKIIANDQAAFVRTGGFEFPLFKFTSVNSIVVTGVKVFETKNKAVQPQPGAEELNSICLTTSTGKCSATLEVYKAQSVEVTHSYFQNGKVFNALFWGVDDLKIDQSRFDEAFLFGIWGAENKLITLTKSVFQRNRSNAFLIDFTATQQALVSQNIFDQNHHATAFHVCGASGTEPCPGGQIDLVQQSQNITITGNSFFNSGLSGEFPEDRNPSLIITGVEFEPHTKTISNVKIDSNYYENNNSGLFYLNLPDSSAYSTFKSDVIVSNNSYCRMPRALFNYANEYQWKSQVKYSNNIGQCLSGKMVIPQPPIAPKDASAIETYSWTVSEWSSCSAAPYLNYSAWTSCSNGVQSRSYQCSGQSGGQTRQVSCLSSSGSVVNDSNCNLNSKPAINQSCSQNCQEVPQTTRTCQMSPLPPVAPPPNPPPAVVTGTISGNSCQLSTEQQTCSSVIQWASPGYSAACVFANGQLFACEGESSTKTASWIVEEGVLFELKASSALSSQTLASVRVSAISPYTLTGSDCFLNGQSTCASTISWKAPGVSTACVFANGQLFACEGESSSKVAPWIVNSGVLFELRQNSAVTSPLLKRLTIRGQ